MALFKQSMLAVALVTAMAGTGHAATVQEVVKDNLETNPQVAQAIQALSRGG